MSSRERSGPSTRRRAREASEASEDCETERDEIPNRRRERSEASWHFENDREEIPNREIEMDGGIVLRENVEEDLNREEGNGDGDEETQKVDKDEETLGRYEYEIEEDVADFHSFNLQNVF